MHSPDPQLEGPTESASGPYRQGEVHAICAECGTPCPGRPCRRCGRPFCAEHAPRVGLRCGRCEGEFLELRRHQARNPYPNWFPFVWYAMLAIASGLAASWLQSSYLDRHYADEHFASDWAFWAQFLLLPPILALCAVPLVLARGRWALRIWFTLERPLRRFIESSAPGAAAPRDGLALASLTFSMIFFLPLFGVAGIVLGIIALADRRRWRDGRKGRGLAWVGVIIGILVSATQLALLLINLHPWPVW